MGRWHQDPGDPGTDVSVVVCYHGGDLLKRCLQSLATSQGVTFETLLITSVDQWWNEPGIGLSVYWEQGGPAHKRNEGVRHAKADTIVFLDDDVEVSPFTLYHLWQGLKERPQAGMLFSRIYNMERREELDDCGSWLTWTGFLYARAGSLSDRADLTVPRRCLASKSATCAVTRRSFLDAGGFDAAYYILGEETDLAWRMWLRGWHVWYEPRAVSWHAFNTSLKPTPTYYTLQRIHRYGARNYLRCLSTNLGLLRLVRVVPCQLAIWTLAALGFVLRGQPARGWAILQGLLDVVRELPAIARKRRQVQGGRTITDRDLMRVVQRSPSPSYYVRRLYQYLLQGLHG